MDKEELKRLDKDLRNCCGQVPYTSFTLQFDRIKKVLDNFPHCECLREQCEKTQEDYQRLLSAFEVSKNGIEDPYRDDLLMSIINNIHIIYQDILMLNAIQEEPLLDAAAKRSFNVDLDQLEESVQRLYDHNEREKASTILFSAILVSRHWSNKRSQQFAELICGDTLQIEDACLMISAIMMSNLVIFDNEKFLCLANIYERAENIYVKERALVGWVFSVSPHGNYLTHEVCEKLNNLLLDKEIQAELQDMQKQIFFCMDAEADADIMQKNVFSKFTSNKAKRIIDLSNDIFDETGVEDIIHPEKEEEEVEKMEEGIQQMIQMEKAGSDIYFDGFSKMKSFAFFHVLSNWFVPFYKENPALHGLVEALDGSDKLLEGIEKNSPFCDSDKYSFAYALTMTLKSPTAAPVKEMLKEGLIFANDSAMRNGIGYTTYVRRMYLQDLYRFFRISHFREAFINIFSTEPDAPAFFLVSPAFSDRLMPGSLKSDSQQYPPISKNIMRFLVKRKNYVRLRTLFKKMGISSHDVEGLYAQTLTSFHNRDVMSRFDSIAYANILFREAPENPAVLNLVAKVYFVGEEYYLALGAYKDLYQLKPSYKIKLKMAYCLMEMDKSREAVKLLYELDYNYPNHLDILRPLAWGLVLRRDAEKAIPIYNKVMRLLKDKGEKPTVEDYFNQGIAYWCTDDKESASDSFCHIADIKKDFGAILSNNEAKHLVLYDIGLKDIALMGDMVLQKLKSRDGIK